MFRVAFTLICIPTFLSTVSLSYANDQAPAIEANKLKLNSDYFVVTDPIGIAFGVNTLGLGIRLGQEDITLAYSYLDTDIPDQDDLEGSAIGVRWNHYLDNLDVAPYVGMVVSYADVDEDDGQSIEHNQYVGAALLGG